MYAWAWGFVFGIFSEIGVVIYGAICLANIKSVEYWAFVLVRNMLIGR